MGKRLSFAEVKRLQREKARNRQRGGSGGLQATHRGGGYYEVRNAKGTVVAESVSKDEAREMGAEV
ncbi:MAG: hypothetical protein ACOC1T_03955 [Halorhodospira sp.]